MRCPALSSRAALLARGGGVGFFEKLNEPPDAPCFQNVVVGRVLDGVVDRRVNRCRGVDRRGMLREKVGPGDPFRQVGTEEAIVVIRVEVGEVSPHRVPHQRPPRGPTHLGHLVEDHAVGHERGAAGDAIVPAPDRVLHVAVDADEPHPLRYR